MKEEVLINNLLKSVLVGVLYFVSTLQMVPVAGVVFFVFVQLRITLISNLRTHPGELDQALIPYSLALLALGVFITLYVVPFLRRNHEDLMKVRDFVLKEL